MRAALLLPGWSCETPEHTVKHLQATPQSVALAATASSAAAKVASAGATSLPCTPKPVHLGVLLVPPNPRPNQRVTVIAATLAHERPLTVRLQGPSPIAALSLYQEASVPSYAAATFSWPHQSPTLEIDDGHARTCVALPLTKPQAWDGAHEALFAAWIAHLFAAPPAQDVAYRAMHEVTRDATRNLLHNRLELHEDAPHQQGGLYLQPDCADTPYFFRAYFAWKLGLPFGIRACSRGRADKPPHCGREKNITLPQDDLAAVQHAFRRTISWGVHTGNGRAPLEDDASDFYPLALTRTALRPGSIFADPYGHILMVASWFPPEEATPGILFAVDGQPDGSLTRKRFWEGNFLWNPDKKRGGSGFKAHRPFVGTRMATNAELASLEGYGDISAEQQTLQASAFYDRMEALITPGPRDAVAALRAAVVALAEQARVRVTSVQNGVAHVQSTRTPVAMPDGHDIFETTGAWENFSTPARDMRLLMAIDVVQTFEGKVRRNAALCVRDNATLPGVLASIATLRDTLLRDLQFAITYRGSNGHAHTLTLQQLTSRAHSLEMAYNPNDCPEIRWGAPAGSAEAEACTRRAPLDQQHKMARYRPWFAARTRPPRGDHGPPSP